MAYYFEHAYYDFFHDLRMIVDVDRYVAVRMEGMGRIVRMTGQEQQKIGVASCIAEVVTVRQGLVVEPVKPRSVVATHTAQLLRN